MTDARLARSIHGVGLFGAGPARLSFLPGSGGIRWRDPASGQTAAGLIAQQHSGTQWTGLPAGVPVRNTSIAAGARVFATIEHVMGALAGLGVWNVDVMLEGVEAPILDGSAREFVDLASGLAAASPGPLLLKAPVEVRHGNASIIATPLPANEPIEYVYELDYGPSSPLPPQRASWRGEPATFAREIAPARTFSMLAEVNQARAMGLFGHLSPAEMLVVGDDGRPIDNAWRMEHEPARHKLLDLIGDLALLGAPLHARVVATRSGHALTHEFCRRVLQG